MDHQQKPTDICSLLASLGFIFEPSLQLIFNHYLPKKILGQPVFDPLDENLIQEIDLYGDKTPEELFGGYKIDDTTKFYFYVHLKKTSKSSTRNIRVAGGGTWHGERPDDFDTVIDGKVMKLGTKRLFKFKLNNKKQEEGGGGSWLMHEYKLDKDFMSCYLKKNQLVVEDAQSIASLCDSLAFCHVYKKTEKKEMQEVQNKRKLVPYDHGTTSMVVFEETKRMKTCDFSSEGNVVVSAATTSHVDDGFRSIEEIFEGLEEEEEEEEEAVDSAAKVTATEDDDKFDINAWLEDLLKADEKTWPPILLKVSN